MAVTNGNSTTYEVNAVVPTELVAPMLHMLQKHGGQLVRVVSHENGARRASKLPAREVILAALAKNTELHRAYLRKALTGSGHSPASVGPICHMLQKDGKIFSPRRGIWQLRT